MRHIKQKVILREKVRKEMWRLLWRRSLGFFKFVFLMGILGFVGHRAYRLLFLSDTFMVKSLTVSAGEVYTPKIAERLRFLKGKTIFSFSSSKLGRDLRRRFPEIRAVRIERRFPDAVRVQVQLFQPLALLKVAERDSQFVDAQGSLLREMHPLRCPPALPEIVVNSTGAIGIALKFVNLWSQSVSGGTEGLSTGSLRKVSLDSWGDFSLVLRDGDHETQVVWGPLDSESFDLQWKRFREVWSDLKKKSVSAGWINLRESVQDSKIVSGRREVVGRVIVRKS